MTYWLLWLIVLLVTIGIEMLTTVLISIWFAFGALSALILALIGVPIEIQVIVFIVVSAFTLTFTKPFVEKKFLPKNKIVTTNVDALIGKEATVTKEISNSKSTGEVLLERKYWTARSENDETIPASSTVVVKRIEGVKVIVSPVDKREGKK